ncbi:hypothetical protein [Rubellimicrobium arenae]|uniref:hypothetical protein n=1 Tax=Rubellimicrobium arenae TaxID=2817372 RepID=UPI001B3175B2|nr:hypothetical protein [Rubellimicrobium arenae]
MLEPEEMISSLLDKIEELEARLREAREWAVPALALYAGQCAEQWHLPVGHLHPVHYDALMRMGAQMDGFVRAEGIANQPASP